MFDWIADPQPGSRFATLTALEIVLGIDNIIFISILVGRLPQAQRERGARARPGAGDAHAHRAAVVAHLGHAA